MATINAINSNKPIEISLGGTAASSFTAYAVVCGGTTSTGALQSIAGVGTSGQVLTSNGAGALPTFQSASGGVSVGFAAYLDAIQSNITGDGTNFTAVFNTEIFDIGGNYDNTTYTFTAPS